MSRDCGKIRDLKKIRVLLILSNYVNIFFLIQRL
jgi:hypothetical protein